MELPDMLSIGEFDAIIFTLFGFAAVSTILRIYSRRFVTRCTAVDDYLIIAALLCGTLLAAFHHQKNLQNWILWKMAEANDGEIDKDSQEVIDIRNTSSRWSLLSEIVYTLELCLIKIAILFFYSRVANRKSHRITLYVVGGVLIAWTVTWFFARLLGTTPREALWTPTSKDYKTEVVCTCGILSIIQSAVHAVVDVALLIIPLPIILKVKVSNQKKIGLLVVYAIGFISLGATITRLTQATTLYFFGSSDVFLEDRATYVMYSVWNALEVNTAIICANLPALVPLIRNRSFMPSSASKPKVYHYPSDKSGSSFNKSGYSNGSRLSPSTKEKSIMDDYAADDNIHLRTDINVMYDRNNVV